MKNTNKALFSSVVALILCCTMLVGSTFAWFTDSASSAVNTIQAGNLNIVLEYQDANGNWVDAEGQTLKFTDNYWEPGCTYKLPELRITNKGNLALKYDVVVNGIDGDAKLLEAIEFTLSPEDGTLLPDDSVVVELSGHMAEEAGNEYQGLKIEGIGITVYATQYTHEQDSNDDQYDVNAEYLAEVKTAAELANALSAGKNVKLINDISVTETLTVPAGVAVELDLNGKTITGTEGRDADNNRIHVIVNNGILTIKDGTVKSAGNDGGSAIYNNAGATLTIEDVTLYGAPQSDPVYEAGVSKPFPSYAVNNYGNAVVNGATIKSYHGAIATGDNGVTVINDADIDVGLGQSTGITSYLIYSYGNAQVTVNGGKFAFTKQEVYVNGGNTFCELGTNPIIINGGNYTGTSFSSGAGREYVIKGGTFDADPSAHVADGYMVTETDGTYVVSVDKENISTADTLAAALAEGGNVKLTGNITVDTSLEIPAGVEVTLDLNGKEIKGTVGRDANNNRIHTLVNNGTLTIKNGTVASTGDNGGSAIYNAAGAVLTIEDTTIEGAPFAGTAWPSYGINNYGMMTVNSATIKTYHGGIATNGDGVTVINYATVDVGQNTETNQTSWALYTSENGKLTVNDGVFENTKNEYNQVYGGGYLCPTSSNAVVINGGTFNKTEADNNGSGIYYNPTNLVITGGTFDTNPSAYVADGYVATENGDGTWTVTAQ